MSDFGAFLEIERKDNKILSENEISTISEQIEKLKAICKVSDSLGKPYQFKTCPKTNSKNIFVLLSEYYTENDFEWCSFDKKDAKVIAKDLNNSIGNQYKVIGCFDGW